MTVDYAIEQGRNVKAGEIYGYFVQTFVMSAISMGATKAIGSYFDQFEKTGLRELRRALAHATFNGTMRFAQGGKPARLQAGLSTGLCQVLYLRWVEVLCKQMPEI